MLKVLNPNTGGTEMVINPDKSTNDYVSFPRTAKGDNLAISIVGAADASKSWYIAYATWRVSGGSVGNTDVALNIYDGENIIYQSVISKQLSNGASSIITFSAPIKITKGNTVTYSIAPSGVDGTVIVANIGLFQR